MKKINYKIVLLIIIKAVILLLYFNCTTPSGSSGGGGSGSSGSKKREGLRNVWTWISGSDSRNQIGIYGAQGVAASTNIPGARRESISWIDASGNFWLFGGYGYDSVGDCEALNDLWMYDGSSWTWISGSNIINAIGIYGTQGFPAVTNIPGARYQSINWIDSSGNFCLFGGEGYDSTGNIGMLNDLWRYDGTNWTWISGSNTRSQPGNYGTQGVPAVTNIPGARFLSMVWIDASGNLWIFGGNGYDSAGSNGRLNDLWMYDGSNWTWISGSNIINATGNYGTQGVAAATNIPGARGQSINWIDTSGNLWIFGGNGYDSAGSNGRLNDLWMYDGSNWTWISGSNVINTTGNYGTQGVATSSNISGARESSIKWLDTSGNLWMFGGSGYDSAGDYGFLNDLWRYRP